jgi:DNA-binding transcriptional ArsR family regulator
MAADRRKPERAPYAYGGLDRVLHEKARLGILIALLNRPDGVLFADLRALCELTDGNLSRHLTVLYEAGIVEIWKNQGSTRSRTLVRLSKDGRGMFLAYLAELERALGDARKSAEGATGRSKAMGPDWAPA